MPDTKDWTWVLDRPCPECGLAAGTLTRDELGPRTRAVAATFVDALAAGDDAVRVRPAPDVWSTLEYACHIRDVCFIGQARLGLLLDEDDPRFDNWDQDASAIEGRYDEQDPATVAAEVQAWAAVLADGFDAVGTDQWARPGTRSNGSTFTVETLGQYLVHDLVHHVWDLEQAGDRADR